MENETPETTGSLMPSRRCMVKLLATSETTSGVGIRRFSNRHAMAGQRPPLACRPSPPQGGRLAAFSLRLFCNVEEWRNRGRQPISPLEGEMPGKAEGGTPEQSSSNLQNRRNKQLRVRRAGI